MVTAALMLVFLTVLAVVSLRNDAALRSDALQPAQAEVISYRERVFRADRLRVRFDVPTGGTQTASIQVSASYTRGQPVEVLDDPARPGRARTAQNWDPASPLGPVVLIGGGGAALLGLSLRYRHCPRPRPGVRPVPQGRTPATMRARSAADRSLCMKIT